MLSNFETLFHEFQGLYVCYRNKQNINNYIWGNLTTNAHRSYNDMLNLVTLFKSTSNDENQKKELFNLSDVITAISHRLAVVSSNKSKFTLQFEQDVPENVYGDMTKFQQVITTLINFTNMNSPNDEVVEIY